MKTLARMAARLAGRDPDKHVSVKLAETVAFDGPAWRYPDFISRAEAAYVALTASPLVLPRETERDAHPGTPEPPERRLVPTATLAQLNSASGGKRRSAS